MPHRGSDNASWEQDGFVGAECGVGEFALAGVFDTACGTRDHNVPRSFLDSK